VRCIRISVYVISVSGNNQPVVWLFSCCLVYTARTWPCNGHVHDRTRPCRVQGCVHDHTAVHGPCTRVHDRVNGLYTAVYSAEFTTRTRPLRYTPRCTQAVSTAVFTAVYGTCTQKGRVHWPYTYRILHGDAPHYLDPLIRIDDLPGRRPLHFTNTNRLVVPQVKLSTVGSRAFAIASSDIWSRLLTDVVAANSLSTFRRLLNTTRPAFADRTARRQFQATGRPVSRTQASDAMT